MWKEFFTVLAAVLLGGGGLGYYFRDRWSHRLSRELEKFKISLAAELFERQTKYAWLHPERAKILVKLYPLLLDAEKSCTDFLVVQKWLMIGRVLDFDDHMEKYSEARDVLDKLHGFIKANGALLDHGLAEQLGAFVRKYEELLKMTMSVEPPRESGLSPIEYVESIKESNDVTSLRNEIQETIQNMLGVE